MLRMGGKSLKAATAQKILKVPAFLWVLEPMRRMFLQQSSLLKVIFEYRRKLALIHLEEFDQNVVGCRNHNIFPEP